MKEKKPAHSHPIGEVTQTPAVNQGYQVRVFVEVMYNGRPVHNADVEAQFYSGEAEFLSASHKTGLDGLTKVTCQMPDQKPGKAILYAHAFNALHRSDKVTVTFGPEDSLIFKHLEF